MPRPDSITIHLHDLQKIIDVLESNQVGACHVKLIDDGKQIQIRDTADFRIGAITKSKTPPENFKPR
jgi:hypothetical protein